MRKKIIECYSDTEPIIFDDRFDEAIIGFDPNTWQVVYSRTKVIGILQTRTSMSEEEALEFAEFDIFGVYIGDKTPIWAEDFNW